MRRIIYIVFAIATLAIICGSASWEYRFIRNEEAQRVEFAEQILWDKLSAYRDKNHRFPNSINELSFTNSIDVFVLPDIRKISYQCIDKGLQCSFGYGGSYRIAGFENLRPNDIASPNLNAVNKSSGNTPPLLTKDQAEAIALRLGDEKLEEERKGFDMNPHYTIFENNLNKTNKFQLDIKTQIQTSFVAGHWKITLWTMDSHSRYFATVELAADGSTNSAFFRREGGLP
jgi:hypothetical protein